MSLSTLSTALTPLSFKISHIIGINYFIDEAEFEYLLRAIMLVAEHGWRLLPLYHFDSNAVVWRYRQQKGCLTHSLDALTFASYCQQTQPETAPALDLRDQLMRPGPAI